MPTATPDFCVQRFTTSSEIPGLVWQTLRVHERNANVILPYLERCHAMERSGSLLPTPQLWISCTTFHRDAAPSVDFVLSSTEGPLGPYPVFIVTTLSRTVSQESVRRRLQSMAFELQRAVHPSRVFSVFALEPIARSFAAIWTAYTGIPLHPTEPEYYAARISYCTKHTFKNHESSPPSPDIRLRLATTADVPQVARLGHGFAAESVRILHASLLSILLTMFLIQDPYFLTPEAAEREAALLIEKGEMWVHEVRSREHAPEIASIVAVTRSSEKVATITKVYTSHKWRKRGCAERLTRKVVDQ